MAQDDFYTAAGRRQWQILQAARAQALGNLENERLYGNEDSAAEAIQTIAVIDSQMRDLSDLHNRYAASQPPPEPSKEELMAKPPERMTHQDMYRILKGDGGSKHGIDDNSYLAGINEAARRRARGE
jgi:hypothetical protein